VSVPPPQRVVGVFAHPDDEIFCAGGTMALWAAEGAEVVVVCATRGEAGQIRDAAVADRRTLGAVREAELRRACTSLGVSQVMFFDYHDGTLHDIDAAELVGRVAAVLGDVDPDVVITFGEDGAYGHPDHVAIGEATATAVADIRSASTSDRARPQLLRSHFPPNQMSLAERLATWLVEMEARFDGRPVDYGRALTLFAEESTTMRFASDDVRIEWFPTGSMIVEQGESATSLCLILSGTVVVVDETDGERRPLRTMREGQFFGELGVAGHRPRSASVIANGNVTCLVLSPTKRKKFEGRGGAAVAFGDEDNVSLADAVAGDIIRIDVSAHLESKLVALASHRSQYPIDVDAFPRSMLQEMYGTEYFRPS
jgi:LmbE family N-acetylglucosaminyl deacetylase